MFHNRSFPVRPVLALILAWLIADELRAEEIAWQKDFQRATALAAQQKKPLLVDVSAEWCGYCKKMEKTTFRDEKLARRINGCFIPVYLDADQNEALVERLGVEGLPTLVVLSPEMQVVRKITGYQTTAQLEKQIAQLCRHEEPTEPQPEPPTASADHAAAVVFAFRQICLVSLLDDGRWAVGSPEHVSTWAGRTVCFATAEHKRRFDTNPARYWPAADGQCVVSARLEGVARVGDPQFALIYAGQLWFFADQTRQQRFYAAPAAFASVVPSPSRPSN